MHSCKAKMSNKRKVQVGPRRFKKIQVYPISLEKFPEVYNVFRKSRYVWVVNWVGNGRIFSLIVGASESCWRPFLPSTLHQHTEHRYATPHMSEFPEPQQESTAACENRDIGPLRKGPKQMNTILTSYYLKNLGLEALQLFWSSF